LLEKHPRIQAKLLQEFTQFKQEPLGGDRRFQTLKERFLVIYSVLRAHPEAPFGKKEHIADFIFTDKDLKGVENALVEHEAGQNYVASAITSLASAFSNITIGSGLRSYWDVRTGARRMSEGDFMTKILTLLVEEPVLVAAASRIGEYFIKKLRDRVHMLASRWAQFMSQAEVDALDRDLQLEAAALHDKNRSNSRAELLHELEQVLVRGGHPK
jgi:hypothetical protein